MQLDIINLTSLAELNVLQSHFDGESVEAEYIEELGQYMFTLFTSLGRASLILRNGDCRTHTIFSMFPCEGYTKVLIIRRE